MFLYVYTKINFLLLECTVHRYSNTHLFGHTLGQGRFRELTYLELHASPSKCFINTFILPSCSVEILGGGVVRVHLSTKLCGHANTALHNFVGLIVGNIQLEEASVSLREGIFVHAGHESNLMLVVKVR